MTDQSKAPLYAWPLIPDFSPDAFRGTARYYERYRPRYPKAMIDHLLACAETTGEGRLLDLACGTGEVALAMRGSFREVWAVDLEAEMVEVGRKKAERDGADNVCWKVGRAEDVAVPAEFFGLVTVGNAFHRLDRRLVSARALEWLPPRRHMAVVGSSSLWTGKEEWQAVAIEVLRKWTAGGGVANKAAPSAAVAEVPSMTHEECLGAAGFEAIVKHKFPTPQTWTLDTFIGYLRSTSVSGKLALAGATAQFEADLRSTLLAYDPSGRYEELVEFYYILARKPDRAT